jgi:ribosomal protein S4
MIAQGKNYKRTRSFLWNFDKLNKKTKIEIAKIFLGFSKQKKKLKQRQRLSNHTRYLIAKRKFSGLYGKLSTSKLQKTKIFAVKSGKYINVNFVRILETRLDMCLFRMNLFKSFYEIRQYIRHGYVFINYIEMNVTNYYLNFGDIIIFKGLDQVRDKNFKITKKTSKNKRKKKIVIKDHESFQSEKTNSYYQKRLLRKKLRSQKVKFLKPNYLEISYKLKFAIFLFPIQDVYFPVNININDVLRGT